MQLSFEFKISLYMQFNKNGDDSNKIFVLDINIQFDYSYISLEID